MKLSFHLKAPRGPFDDAFLFLRPKHEAEAVLFDLGESPLEPGELLRVKNAFISHTHMDHFSRFDRLLRQHLRRSPRLALWGPEGFLDRLEARLASYTWNLTGDYALTVAGHELTDSAVRSAEFPACRLFRRVREKQVPRRTSGRTTAGMTVPLLTLGRLTVRGAVLDHGIPCLGFRLEEGVRVRIRPDHLRARRLRKGPWLAALKEAVAAGKAPDTVMTAAGEAGSAHFALSDLADLYELTRGQTVAYVTDAADTRANASVIRALAREVDILYIEGVFLAQDAALARERCHLTASRAGELAARAGARRVRLLHLSPRYQGREDEILAEAREAAGKGIAVEGAWRKGKG